LQQPPVLELSGSKMILAGLIRWYDAAPPNWLNDILANEHPT
jgi:hypothetical protein